MRSRSWNSSSPSPRGRFDGGGPTQGFRPALKAAGYDVADSPFGTGPVDAVLTATLGEYATGVGEAKLVYDGATFIGSAIGCLAGLVR